MIYNIKYMEIEINLKNELLTTTNTSFRRLLELGGDAMALYMFYLYTSNWQDNQSPKAVTSFTAKGLGWSVSKVIKNKKLLIKNGWIEEKQTRGEDGRIKGHYITVKYRVSTQNTTPPNFQRVDNPGCGFSETNTPIINKIHHKDNKILQEGVKSSFVLPQHLLDIPEFVEIWEQFLKQRKPKTNTKFALELILKKMKDNTTDEMIEMLEQSVTNGWQGIFPVRKEKVQIIYKNQISEDFRWIVERYEYTYTELADLYGKEWLAEKKKETEDLIFQKTGKKLVW